MTESIITLLTIGLVNWALTDHGVHGLSAVCISVGLGLAAGSTWVKLRGSRAS